LNDCSNDFDKQYFPAIGGDWRANKSAAFMEAIGYEQTSSLYLRLATQDTATKIKQNMQELWWSEFL